MCKEQLVTLGLLSLGNHAREFEDAQSSGSILKMNGMRELVSWVIPGKLTPADRLLYELLISSPRRVG